MSNVNVKLNWDEGLRFTGTTATGHKTILDGDSKSAASPVEVLLEAIGACAAIDVVLIMGKVRTPLSRLEIDLDGTRHSPEPRYYTDVRVRFDAWGDGVNPDKLARAISLSFEKYCSVYHSLRKDLSLRAEFRIHSTGAPASGDYREATI